MQESTISNNTNIIKNEQQDELFSTLVTPVILADGNVPLSHKQAADNYIIIKRLYKNQSLVAQLTSSEINLLKKYNFKALVDMSIQEVNKELINLQQWSADDILKKDADEIIRIRAKELRSILSSNYSTYSLELGSGYKSLEKYFEEITKFRSL